MKRTRAAIAEAITHADGQLLGDEVKEFQREKFPVRIGQWPEPDQALWETFRSRVLEHGGYEVVPPTFADELVFLHLRRGRTFDAYRARFATWRGGTSKCHSNVADLFVHGEVDQIGTGFALSGDGLWRQHSWGLLGDWTAGDPRQEREIAETTEHRLLYYGTVLTQAEAERFSAAHL